MIREIYDNDMIWSREIKRRIRAILNEMPDEWDRVVAQPFVLHDEDTSDIRSDWVRYIWEKKDYHVSLVVKGIDTFLNQQLRDKTLKQVSHQFSHE